MFLLPAKTLRQTSGLPGSHLDTTSNEDSFSFQVELEDGDENSSQGDTQVPTTTGIPKEVVSNMQEPIRKRKAVPSIEHDDTNTTILEMMKQRQAEKSKESPRLYFFRSLMPSVDNLDEEQFLKFQIDVLKALQLQTQTRVPRLAGAYQQQQSPSPSSNFSDVSRDSCPAAGYHTYRPLPGPSNQQESYPERATTSYNTYEYYNN